MAGDSRGYVWDDAVRDLGGRSELNAPNELNRA